VPPVLLFPWLRTPVPRTAVNCFRFRRCICQSDTSSFCRLCGRWPSHALGWFSCCGYCCQWLLSPKICNRNRANVL